MGRAPSLQHKLHTHKPLLPIQYYNNVCCSVGVIVESAYLKACYANMYKAVTNWIPHPIELIV